METRQEIYEIFKQFSPDSHPSEIVLYGNGHINDTYRVTCPASGGGKHYILQKMNREVFQYPVRVMENICGVTGWLKHKIRENGGDEFRETLTFLNVKDGRPYYRDNMGEYWRACLFIENAECYDMAKNERDFYQSAVAFGHFQHLLADYPAETLYETIPEFHNTEDRYRKFEQAVSADPCGRRAAVMDEIRFVRQRRELCPVLREMQRKGELPVRVTHNDTKLNNVMIDHSTGKAICVIDLDTVMPGLSAYDFGDSIRFGAATAGEDERDLSRMSFSLTLYEAYVRGFLEGCQNALTERELDMLPMGAIVMTYECGMRFLTDFLEGDHYFKTHREGHNLDRARTQFKLVREMEEKQAQMRDIVTKYRFCAFD
ncbi:MAG: aminoglycoside phosphotransferase family protein [Clostridiales bacterium]|nr:aminoglycoside phosphotransferase family protein [Clostridiales bacterium]